MEWIQLIESISGVFLVIVTVGLLAATNIYRKATEQMAKIQQKSMEVQQKHADLQEKDADYLKKDNAINLIYRWDDPGLLKARAFTRDISERRQELSPGDLLKEIEEGGHKESLIHVFNFWERVRYSVTYDRADEEILKVAFRRVYVSMYERFKVWLDKQPYSYRSDLEKLYERWRSES